MTLDLSPDVFNRRILAAARVLAGLSQAELASAAGIHLNALQRIEAGGNMRASTFGKLLRALDALGVEALREADGPFSGVRFKAIPAQPVTTTSASSESTPRKRGKSKTTDERQP